MTTHPCRLFPLFLCLAVTLFAAVPSWENADNAILDTEQLKVLGSQTTSARYPDADEVILFEAHSIRYEADGRNCQVLDRAVKLLTESSLRANSVVSSWYNARNSRARIDKVQIIKPDGRIIDLDVAKLATTVNDTSSMKANIYESQDLLISVPVAGLETGDILRWVLTDELLKPKFHGFFGQYFGLEDYSPVLNRSIRIDAPAALPLKSIVLLNEAPGIKPRHTTGAGEDGRILYNWKVKEVPQVFPEPSMPTSRNQLMTLMVSTAASWQEISSWYNRLSNKRMNITPEIRDMVKQLTAEAEDDEAKIRKIFEFVSQKVRYMGVTAEAEAPGWEPHEIAMTFNQRAGVCRDKAALLAAMLREAGFPAAPVLISTNSPMDGQAPTPYFNHAITGILRKDGSWMLMDSTPTEGRDLLPQYLAGKSFLPATEKGETLMRTPVPAPSNAASYVRTWATLQTDGTMEASTTIVLNGIADDAYRYEFLAIQNPALFLKSLFALSLPGVRFDKLTISPADLLDNSAPLTIKANYTIADALAAGGDSPSAPLLLSIPSLAKHLLAHNAFFRNATLEKRRFPYERQFISAFTENISISLPRQLGIGTVPQPLKLNSDGFSFSREFFPAPGRIDINQDYATGKLLFSPEEYTTLKDFQAKIAAADRNRIVLIRKEEAKADEAEVTGELPAAAVVENYICNVIINSTRSWIREDAFRYRITSRKGLNELSELILKYNPAWEDVELKYARVINDGVIIPVSDELIHHLDNPENGDAPRYPGSKTLAVNFPSVKIGSIIEYCVARTQRSRPFFTLDWKLRQDYPVETANLSVYVPKELNIKPEYMPWGMLDIPSKEGRKAFKPIYRKDKLADGRIKYTWTGMNIPQIPEEEAVAVSTLPCVTAATGDWEEYAGELNLVVQSLGDGGEAAAEVARRFSSLPANEKVIAIRNWMELNIRHAGPEFHELPLSALTRPEITLQDGYGNSADRAILYQAILKAAGFENVQLYLAGNSDENRDLQQLTAAYPTLGDFTRWLVWLRHPETGEIWLNDQNRHAQFGTCTADRTLLLNLQTGQLASMQLEEKFADIDKSTINYIINDDGSAEITCTTSYQGTAFGNRKRFYAEIQPEERRRHHQELLNSLASGAKADGELLTEFRLYPGAVSFKARLAEFAPVSGPICYFRIPLPAPGFLSSIYDVPRQMPIYLGKGEHAVREYIFQLPPAFPKVLTMPRDFFWNAPSGAGSYSVKCRMLPGGKPAVKVTVEYISRQSILTPAEYRQLVDACRKLASPDMNSIILTR